MVNTSLVENFELVISNDDNNSPKESKCFQQQWQCQQICSKFTSLSSARQIYHWPAHNSINFQFAYSLLLFLLYTNIPMFKKCNVLLSLVMSTFPVLSLLCQIWPGFIQKSSLFYQQSLGMIQTHVPIFLKSLYLLSDKIRTTVQLITYTFLQNCLSLFTIHHECSRKWNFHNI